MFGLAWCTFAIEQRKRSTVKDENDILMIRLNKLKHLSEREHDK
jgi:hypothetical protein